ncbi:MAG: hypothetical protein V4578_13235 [Pseudomonadota bacterium]
MEYQAKQAVYLPVTDFLNLEFHLMDTRPGIMHGASSGYVFLGTITGSGPPIAESGPTKDYAGYNLPLSHHTGLSRRAEKSKPVPVLLCGGDCGL